MKTIKRKNTRETISMTNYKENHFHRLPDDTIVSIFNIIADLKCLCRCSLVSKHFASIIPHVQTVSVTVPDITTHDSDGFMRRMTEFAVKLKDSAVEKIPALVDAHSLQHLKLPMFLHKLKEIKFISLSYKNNGHSHFPMCRIILARNSAEMERFVALIPESVYKDNEDEPGLGQGEGGDDETGKVTITDCFWRFCGRYTEWLCLILILVKYHTSLHGVTINDSYGKLVIVDEEVDNIHHHVFQQFSKYPSSDIIIRYVELPVLHLPLSGYKLKGVVLWFIDAPGDLHEMDKKICEENTFWDCDDEWTVREAIKEVMKNRRDDIHTF